MYYYYAVENRKRERAVASMPQCTPLREAGSRASSLLVEGLYRDLRRDLRRRTHDVNPKMENLIRRTSCKPSTRPVETTYVKRRTLIVN